MQAALRAVSAAPRRWIRRLYDWTMKWADTPQSMAALLLIAVAESSVFPVPPDVLLIAIVASNPRRWLQAAGLCTVGSVLGAAVGYYIGMALMATAGQRIVDFYGAKHHHPHPVQGGDDCREQQQRPRPRRDERPVTKDEGGPWWTPSSRTRTKPDLARRCASGSYRLTFDRTSTLVAIRTGLFS
ncbi:MAG: YqaA family protein [Vicinamibacterales bacterium]